MHQQDQSAFRAPPAVYNFSVYALALSASMGSAMFGYDSAFIGGTITLPSFTSRFGLSSVAGGSLSALKANIVSTFQAGCFFGAILPYPLSERFGRRLTLMVCGAVFCIGAIVQLASTGILAMIYVGRVLTGLAVGASSLVVPQYISECSPPAIRGRLIGLFEICLQIAQVIGFWVNYGVSENLSGTSDAQWRVPVGLQLLPGGLLVILMSFQPESPRWLLSSGNESKGIAVLSSIRHLPADDPYVQWEIATIKEQIHREEELGSNQTVIQKLRETFTPGNRYRLFIGMGLMVFQNLSGINALNYFSSSIFQSVGFTGTNVGLLSTGVFGIAKTSATVVFMLFLVDRLGRRKSLLIGSAGALVSMFYIGAYTHVSNSFAGQAQKDGGAYMAMVMIYLFSVFYAISWNGVPWIFCAEVFPTAIRSICLVFTTCTQWLAQFVIVYSTPYMIANITYGTFLFFGSSLVVAMVVVYFLLPETKGLTLEDMDILFSTKGSASLKRRQADNIITSQRVAEASVPEVAKETAVHIEKRV